jgi:cation diffusion facilitator CzcD-associated flavoprotein CzcO
MITRTRIAIIGTGFSGIALGHYLLQAGYRDFVMLEKADEVGGTWRENTYPGAECDVPSALYSFSFEPSSRWRYKWAAQPQILDYLRGVANNNGLYTHIRFGRQVVGATWDAARSLWSVRMANGEVVEAQFVVSALGQLHVPMIPDLPGRDSFSGPAFHSAQWRHDVDLAGKRIAVIGNAASAIQLIPQIATQAAKLTVFQRSANWILPKQDRSYARWEHWLMEHVPPANLVYRLKLWLLGEVALLGIMQRKPFWTRWGERNNKRYLERVVKDPELRRKLTPDYPIGAKRVLFSDDYYTALVRPNVELVTNPIAGLTPSGVRCSDGREIPADVVIYATGFRTNPFLGSIEVRGRDGQTLAEHWQGGATAYMGLATHGFPNLFMMYGPNTNLGHNSIVVMLEAQARYLVACLQEMDEAKTQTLEVRADAEKRYNEEIQQRLASMAWNAVEKSWYKDGGRITNNWPGSTWEYMQRCARPDFGAFQWRA